MSSAVTTELVPLTGDAHALLVTLNRPDKLNALNPAVVSGLVAGLQQAAETDSVRVVLITGAGRAFCAGGDLDSYRGSQRDPDGFPATIDTFQAMCRTIRELSKPVVALVNGITAAGGLELTIACDFAYLADSARIGDCHLNYGQIGGGGALAVLPRIIGVARARELVFSGRFLSAAEALDWGLVNRVVPDESLLKSGVEFAEEVARKSPLAVASAKEIMNTGWAEAGSLHSALRLERERTALYCLTREDPQEGLQAFVERREPRYTGR